MGISAVLLERGQPDIGDNLAAGDPSQVFADLFDRVAPELLRYLTRRVGDDAEDLLSDTFLLAFELRDGYDPERGEVRPWLFGIASNVLRRHLRQEQRHLAANARNHVNTVRHLDSHDDSVAAAVDAGRVLAGITVALGDLAPADRDVLLLTAWGGLSTLEVAQALDIPAGTVRSRLHRVRRSLRASGGAASTSSSRDSE